MHPKAVLEHAADLVHAMLKLDHPADAIVSRYFRSTKPRLGPRERHTLAETAYAVLRHKQRLELHARSGTGDPARRMAILGMACGLPEQRPFLEAALEQRESQWLKACEAVPEADYLDGHRHNLPAWLAKRLAAELPGGTAELAQLGQSMLLSAPLDLRVNVLKDKRDTLLESPDFVAVKAQATPYSPIGIRILGRPALQNMAAFEAGSVEVQDEGSQLLALLVDARRGEMVADFCAGAGGKTLALGAAMRNSGRLYAFDVSAHRLDALKPRLARSGLSNIHPVVLAHENDERVKRLAGKMDRVLVDAPCSGLGTLRRNPDLKWRQTESGFVELQTKQRAILASAARLVKPGGRLVYATCSLLSDENEAIADAFSAAHEQFELLDVAELLAQAKIATTSVSGHSLSRNRMLRMWPHQHATDGFFAAVWQRKA